MSISSKSLYSNGKLTDESKAKLLKIKEREELKNKLVTKYDQKVKADNEPKEKTSYADTVKTEKPITTTNAVAPTKSIYDDLEEPTNIERKKKEKVEASANSEWAAIIKYNNEAVKAEERLHAELAKKGQLALKQDLDKQVEKSKKEKLDINASKKDLLKITEAEVEKYHKEELEKKKAIAEHLKKEKEAREVQIKDGALRKQRQQLKERHEEEENVKRIQRELQDERDRLVRLKEEHANTMKLIISENEKERQQKWKLIEKEKEEAVNMQKRYIEMMEKQERERENALKTLLDRQSQSQAMYAATVGSNLAQQMAEDEKRAQLMQDEFNRLRLEKEKQDKIKLAKKNEETKQQLNEQMQFREDQKRKEKESEQRYAEQIRIQTIKAKQDNEEYLISLRKKQEAQKNDLELQIQDHERRKHNESSAMTDAERKLNAKLLAAVDTKVKPVPKVDEVAYQKTPFPWKVIERKAPF